jgi:hypothetical protein
MSGGVGSGNSGCIGGLISGGEGFGSPGGSGGGTSGDGVSCGLGNIR